MELDIPGYKIEKLIAEGGMADVYLATQESLQRRVALKLLKKFDNSEQSDRFINEGRIIASLYHSNIITIHDIGKFGEQHYISMEYLEGGDLERRIRHGMLPEEAVDIVAIIGSCLELVHSKGIVHRDIKPANILFRKDQTAVLTDFGIAKQLDQDTNLTMDGTAMGSPDYLSPEQAACKKLDGRADIYSLGIVFYEMLMGQKPFKGDSYIETVMKHISAPIPTLPKELECYQTLLERMIAKDASERFASVNEMLIYIDDYVRPAEGRGLWAKLLAFIRRRRNRKTEDLAVDNNEIDKTVAFSSEAIESATENMLEVAAGQQGHSSWLYRGFKWLSVVAVFSIGTLWVVEQNYDDTLPVPANQSAVVVAEKSVTEPVVTASNRQVIKDVPAEDDRLFLLSTDDEDDAESEVDVYLGKANSALKAYKLTLPKNDNAYAYYSKVLSLQPNNRQARQGMVEIANRYALLAEREIDRYDYKKAEHYINTGLRVKPGHKKLVALRKRTSPVSDIPRRLYESIESVFD